MIAALALSADMMLPIAQFGLGMLCYTPAALAETFRVEGKEHAMRGVAPTGELLDVWLSPQGDLAVTITLRLPGSPVCIMGEGVKQ